MPPSDQAVFRPGQFLNAGPHSRSWALINEIWLETMIMLSIGASGAELMAANPCPMCKHITMPSSQQASK